MRFWMSRAIRESRYRTSFSNTKFFFDCDDIFAFSSRSVFWAVKGVSINRARSGEDPVRTTREVVFNLQVLLLGRH